MKNKEYILELINRLKENIENNEDIHVINTDIEYLEEQITQLF